MGREVNTDWHRAAASALDWWHEAGVDVLVDELPRDWLHAPAPTAPSVLAAEPDRISEPGMPVVLADFLAWRSGADTPEAGWSGVSLAASGPADAAVMVLVDCPDRDDCQAGQLLSGASGRLFDRMLASIGLDRGAIHLAAVCAKRPAAGRVMREVEERLGAIARHHVGLIRPKRLLLLGDAASRSVLGTDVHGAHGGLRCFNHDAGQVEVVATFHPRFLLDKPAAKAEAWKDLQVLIEGLDRG